MEEEPRRNKKWETPSVNYPEAKGGILPSGVGHSRDKSGDQCSICRNMQITEQKDLHMISMLLAFR